MNAYLFHSIIFVVLFGFIAKCHAEFHPTFVIENCRDSMPEGNYFTANALISRVRINKNDPTDYSSKIKITWSCNTCQFVVIDGLDSIRRSPSGEIELDANTVAYKVVGVTDTTFMTKNLFSQLAFKKGTGIDGRIFYLKENKGALSFRNSFKYFFNSAKTVAQLKPQFIAVLQSFGYSVDENESTDNTIYLECHPYQSNSLVCSEDDCRLPPSRRSTQRKLAIDVYLLKTNQNYELDIRPSVMQNHPKQDNIWNVEQNPLTCSKNACDTIAKRIQDAK
jgi:hypothetical protein